MVDWSFPAYLLLAQGFLGLILLLLWNKGFDEDARYCTPLERGRDLLQHWYESTIRVVRWIPVLWKSQVYDFQYVLPLIEMQLKLYLEHIQKCQYHDHRKEEDASGASEIDEIHHALTRLQDFQDPFRVAPYPKGAEAGFRKQPGEIYSSFYSNPKFSAWSESFKTAEDQAWEDFWNILRKQGRAWWC